MSTLIRARANAAEMVAMRRHLHANPELNFAEFATSNYAREYLENLGFTVKQAGGATGLVADFGARNSEGVVALRCDMDAMLVHELNRDEYASRSAGVMHACGHDVNLAVTLGAARLLSEMAPGGAVRIIIQPGENEDGVPGATTMIDAGALNGVTALLGVHVDATIATGRVGIVAGATMPLSQNFEIEISDSDDDEPDLALAVATIVSAIYDIAGALKVASDQITITVDIVEVASLNRVARIVGTVKTFSADLGLRAKNEIERIVESKRTSVVTRFNSSAIPTVDSALVTAVLHEAAVDLLGQQNVLSIKRKSWNYQFLLYTEHVPGSMIYLGAELSSNRRTHQSPTFDIDENCLPIGASVLAEAAVRLVRNFHKQPG